MFTSFFNKLKQFIYPAIGAFILISIIVIFVLSAKFLSENVNKAFFTPDEKAIESQIIKIDLPTYNLVINKLGINTASVEQQPIEISQIQEISSSSISTTSTSTQATVQEIAVVQFKEKSALKIQILNSTKTSGLAAGLQALLAAADFRTEKTGNQAIPEETTLIKIKEVEKDSPSIGELIKIISKKYASPIIQALEAENEFDVIIVIGRNNN